jgi:hypothetical protein
VLDSIYRRKREGQLERTHALYRGLHETHKSTDRLSTLHHLPQEAFEKKSRGREKLLELIWPMIAVEGA